MCRRELCVARVAAHKAEVAELKSKLLPLQRTFNTLVQGEARRADVELLEARKQIGQLEELRLEELSRRRWSDRAARGLLEENELLLAKVGELSASNASLIGKHAAGVRKAMLEKRQALAREKQLLANVARAEKSAGGAKEAEAEAKQAEVEAEERALFAEELRASAEVRADEAILEAKSAAEAAADAAEEASDADYVAAVLKGKLRRAELKAEAHIKRAAEDRAEQQRGPRDRTVDEWAALAASGPRTRRRSASGSTSPTSCSRTRGG